MVSHLVALNHNSYKNAQYSREIGQCPRRRCIRWALFGQITDLEIIVPFYSEELDLHLRERRTSNATFARGRGNSPRSQGVYTSWSPACIQDTHRLLASYINVQRVGFAIIG